MGFFLVICRHNLFLAPVYLHPVPFGDTDFCAVNFTDLKGALLRMAIA